jgi:hypothetical protein
MLAFLRRRLSYVRASRLRQLELILSLAGLYAVVRGGSNAAWADAGEDLLGAVVVLSLVDHWRAGPSRLRLAAVIVSAAALGLSVAGWPEYALSLAGTCVVILVIDYAGTVQPPAESDETRARS